MKKPKTATEQAYTGIVNLILMANLRPGERTSVKLLADRLSLGRTPVKEAITRLQTEGVFSVAGRSGTTVRAIDENEARQLFILRRTLEDLAAVEAVQRVKQSELENINRLLGELRKTSLGMRNNNPASAADFVRWNVAFHAAIVSAAHNPFLDRLYSQIQLQVQIVSYLIIRGENSAAAEMRQEEHASIVEALERRDAALLRQRLRRHSEVTEKAILETLEANMSNRAAELGSN